jgi:taurine dioxygenase
MAFAQRWGELVRHPYSGMKAYPDVIELRNHGKAKDVNQHWHSDMTYNAAPPKLTMLYALETPEIGGDTAFANQELAYDGLSKDCAAWWMDSERCTPRKVSRRCTARASWRAAREHPVVRVHDETGRKSLYVCRAFTQRFVGWSRDESAPLLEYLYRHASRPEFQAPCLAYLAIW